jgi:hypothetical protein
VEKVFARRIIGAAEPALNTISVRALTELPRVKPHLAGPPEDGFSIRDLLAVLDRWDTYRAWEHTGNGPEFPGRGQSPAPDFPNPNPPRI